MSFAHWLLLADVVVDDQYHLQARRSRSRCQHEGLPIVSGVFLNTCTSLIHSVPLK